MRLLPLLVAGCSVTVSGNGSPDGRIGGDEIVDARPLDAPPDARACLGGDARMQANDGTCIVRFDTARTFADAEAACVAFGAKLALLTNAGRHATAVALAGSDDVWMGLSDRTSENTFVWIDNSPLLYADFYEGEPNNGSNAFEEDCALVNGARGGEWDDRPCAPDPNAGVAGAYPYFCSF